MVLTAAAVLELELLVLLARGWAVRGLEWAEDLSARILAVGVNIAAQDIDTAALCVLLEDTLLAVTKIGWPTNDVSLELRDGLQEARLLSARIMAAEGWQDWDTPVAVPCAPGVEVASTRGTAMHVNSMCRYKTPMAVIILIQLARLMLHRCWKCSGCRFRGCRKGFHTACWGPAGTRGHYSPRLR